MLKILLITFALGSNGLEPVASDEFDTLENCQIAALEYADNEALAVRFGYAPQAFACEAIEMREA